MRERSKIKNASSVENPIFVKAASKILRNKDPRTKIIRSNKKKNPRLKGK
jgi:hypothetical protein